MYGDHNASSPNRGRVRDDEPRPSSSRDNDRYESRHDYHRSPARNYDMRDDDDHSYRRNMMRYESPDDGHSGRYDDHHYDRPARQRDRYPQRDSHEDYEHMYDEERHSERGGGRSYDRDRRRDNPDDQYNRPSSRERNPRSLSPGRGTWQQGRSYSPRAGGAGKPSDTVIIEGLPSTISAEELRTSVHSSCAAVATTPIDVRVPVSKGKRRAFVQFQDVEQAIVFAKAYSPWICIQLQSFSDEAPDGKIQAFIHFAASRSRDDIQARRAPITHDWICEYCQFLNFSTRDHCKECGSERARNEDDNGQESLTGEADAATADSPSQILVIYPLPPLLNEHMFAEAVKNLEMRPPSPAREVSAAGSKLKSTVPGGNLSRVGARPGSLHRVFLMRDYETNDSYKYGFAEFWTVEDAMAALRKSQMPRAITVSGSPVTVCTIHMGVFVPVTRPVDSSNEHLSFHPLFNPTLRVKYRDSRAYPSQLVVAADSPTEKDGKRDVGNSDAGDIKKPKKRKADGALSASAPKKPVAMGGRMAIWQKKHDELHEDGGEQRRPPTESEASTAASGDDTTSISSNAKKANAHAPMKFSITGLNKSGSLGNSAQNAGAKTETQEELSTSAPDVSAEPTRLPKDRSMIAFIDRDRLMCLLCMRKYKDLDEVNVHEKSRNHKTKMEDDDAVRAALERLANRGKRAAASTNKDQSSTESQYRDRAKERREAFKQPNKPSTSSAASGKTSSGEAKTASSQGKKSVSSADSGSNASPAPVSKGAGMLAKMGWTTGSGLGAKGEGRTEVIATNAYQEGVGLGAQGSNLGDAAELAERKTKNSYADFVSTAKDKARERYNQMG